MFATLGILSIGGEVCVQSGIGCDHVLSDGAPDHQRAAAVGQSAFNLPESILTIEVTDQIHRTFVGRSFCRLAEIVGDGALPGDRQTDQIIEGLDQIHRALLALILIGDFHSVGEGIGERLHVQQAAAALQIHHVVDQVILAQQRLELSTVVGKLDNGIVTIQVANKSDKDLSFQRKLKLMRWSTGKEVEPVSDTIVFDGTEFEAHTNGVMTVDLSKAYDMDFLEQPLADDNYYFVLTNNNFMFGQDWMCFVTFAEPIKTVVDDPIPVTPVEADKELVAQIMEELQPYFENYYTDIADRRNHADNYLVKCQELLATLDRDIVDSEASPLAIDGLNPDVVFDKTAPLETQHWLTGLHEHTLDGYGIPVGSAEGESALVLSAYVPQHKGEVDGGAEVPLLYFFTYSVDDIQSPEDYAFIHGQIITFEQLEQYKVYEDDQYVCYEVTDLFYTNLRQHVESIISQRSDIYFDEQVWERVENIYTYYKDRDVLASRFYYNVPVE